MNNLFLKIIISFYILIVQNLCWSQDSVFIQEKEIGRYMNVSVTNLEIRALDLNSQYITIEKLGSENRIFRIVERNKNIIKAQYENWVLFFELRRKKIVFYQYVEVKGESIESYRKGEQRIKNIFKKVNFKLYYRSLNSSHKCNFRVKQ